MLLMEKETAGAKSSIFFLNQDMTDFYTSQYKYHFYSRYNKNHDRVIKKKSGQLPFEIQLKNQDGVFKSWLTIASRR